MQSLFLGAVLAALAIPLAPAAAQTTEEAPPDESPPTAEGAATSTESAEELARDLFIRAREAFEAERLPEARELLEQSLTTFPRASTALNLAQVLQASGEIIRAHDLLEEVLANEHGEVNPDAAPNIEALRGELAAAIATLSVTVAGAAEASVQIDDGRAVVIGAGNHLTQLIDPGRHHVAVVAGDRHTERDVDLAPGEVRRLRVDLPAPVPTAVEVAAAAEAESPEDSSSQMGPETSATKTDWTWLWVGAGVLVAAMTIVLVVVLSSQASPQPDEDGVFPIIEALVHPRRGP